MDLGDVVGSIVGRAMRERRAVLSRVRIFFYPFSGAVTKKKIAPGRSDWVGAGRASERSSIYISFFSGQK